MRYLAPSFRLVRTGQRNLSTMLESAHILASVSVILLIVAIVAWVNPLARSKIRRLNGSAAAADVGHLQIAAVLLLAAVGLSAVAAMLAITGWFAT